MRIVHVIPSLMPERGGPTTVVAALARQQLAAGHEVTILTTNQGAAHGKRPIALPPGVEVHEARVWGPDRLAYARGFAALVRRHFQHGDIVHCHSIFTYPVHVALREARDTGVPLVLRPCGQLHRYSLARSRLIKRAYLLAWGSMVRAACRAWHFTSAAEAHDSWPWDASPRFVLPNGIAPQEFDVDRAAAREQVGRLWPPLKDVPFVLFLGRLHPKKRLDLLLAAFLEGMPPTWKLVVAGPDERGLWSSLAARHLGPSASERVVRLGTVLGADKAALLASARVFALPSQHENFGIAALEALAAGTPVLLSEHVDLAPPVVAAGFGRTVPLDVRAWALALGAIGNQPEDANFSARARQWVNAHYAWGRIASELESQYRAVIQGTPLPSGGTPSAQIAAVGAAAEPITPNLQSDA